VAREIALLTNPSAGKGAGSRTAAIVLPRLKEAGFSVWEMEGRDGAEALTLARQAVAHGVESLVVVGGDGMVHMAVQALAGSDVNCYYRRCIYICSELL
jgi:diacylglycerol kinase (ATP)